MSFATQLHAWPCAAPPATLTALTARPAGCWRRYWTDLTLGTNGKIYTKYFDPNAPGFAGSCKYGIASGAACCATTCGQCGGVGCENFPGGEEHCCTHAITGDGHHHDLTSGEDSDDGSDTSGVALCRDVGGRGPCKIDDNCEVWLWLGHGCILFSLEGAIDARLRARNGPCLSADEDNRCDCALQSSWSSGSTWRCAVAQLRTRAGRPISR